VASLVVPSSAITHDLWLLAGQYRLQPSETTRVFINSGDRFPESLSLLGEHRVTALALHTPGEPGEKVPITEFRVEGKSLTFEITPAVAGSHVVALSTRARRVRLKAEDFRTYLEANALDAISKSLSELGEERQPAVERYAKWAKAIIDVGELGDEEDDSAWSRLVGHTIEIVPLANPNSVPPGGRLQVRVVYDGEPLAGASVTGGKAGSSEAEVVAVTDADGIAEVSLLSAGRWYLRTIHMIRLEGDPEVRWESFWATLTFELRAS
jgi:uncharacterized GH25 family protein